MGGFVELTVRENWSAPPSLKRQFRKFLKSAQKKKSPAGGGALGRTLFVAGYPRIARAARRNSARTRLIGSLTPSVSSIVRCRFGGSEAT